MFLFPILVLYAILPAMLHLFVTGLESILQGILWVHRAKELETKLSIWILQLCREEEEKYD